MQHLSPTSKLKSLPVPAADITDGSSNTVLLGEMRTKKKPEESGTV